MSSTAHDGERSQPRPLRQIALTLAGGVIVVIILAVVKVVQVKVAIAANAFTPPPEVITSTVVQPTRWQREIHAVGSLASVQGVTLSAELPGRVTKIAVENGAHVNAGDILVELDTSVEEADLRAAEARLWRARHAFERSKSLQGSRATSQADVEEADAGFREAQASVESLRAMIVRKRIAAPFAGELGIRTVNLGQYVLPGAPIVPLYSLDPLFANFDIPQQSVDDVAVGQTVTIVSDSLPGREFVGTIHAVNPNLNETTRTLAVQALLPNPQQVLRPGMFVSVALRLAQFDEVIPVPLTAVKHAPYGDSLFIIEQLKDAEGKEYQGVREQLVTLGTRRGDLVAVREGIPEGAQIATSGVFKLRQGAAVRVDNALAPPVSLAPSVEDS